jgi:hypothetical protein
MNLQIRKATLDDLDCLMEIFEEAVVSCVARETLINGLTAIPSEN